MNTRTIGVAGFAVTLALTGCATAPEPVVTDHLSPNDRFELELIDYPELFDPAVYSHTLALADQTCTALDAGSSYDALVETAESFSDPEFVDQTVAITRAAVLAYCPEYRNQLED